MKSAPEARTALRSQAAVMLGLMALSFFVSHLCLPLFFSGGATFEFCHYAEIARNILEGKGFSTALFWPGELAYLERAGSAADPLGPPISRYPLFAYWSAFWMALGGGGDYGMLLGGMAALAFWCAGLYWTARRLFGNPQAWIVAVLWSLLPILQAGYAVGGYTDTLFSLLALLLLFGAASISLRAELQKPGAYLALGLLAGAAQLTRSALVLWLPVLLALPLCWRPKRRFDFPLFFLAGFLAAVLPWLLFFRRSFDGAPPLLLWHLAEGVLIQGLPWMEYRVLSPSEFLNAEVLRALLDKAWHQLNNTLANLPGMWNLEILFPFAAAGYFKSSGLSRRFADFSLILFGWQLLTFSFLHDENLVFLGHRYYLWFSPVIALFAVDFLARRCEGKKGRVLAAAVLLVQAQFMASLYAARYRSSRDSMQSPVALLPELRYIQSELPENAAVLTNIPAQTAWYTRRKAVNIPNRPSDAPRMLERWPADYLLISLDGAGEPGKFPEWLSLLGGAQGDPEQAFARLGFKPVMRFPRAWLFKKI